MGIRDRLRLVRDVAMPPEAPAASRQVFAGPSVTAADVFALTGPLSGSVTRAQALSVPGILKARNIICSISSLQLRTLDPARKRVREPLFAQIDPDVANVAVISATVDDLLFEGVAWWQVLSRGWNDFPTSARHLDNTRVTLHPPHLSYVNRLPSGIDPASVVWVDGRPVSKRDVIRFDSPNPGILQAAKRTILRALQFEQAAELYARDPRALEYLTLRDEGADPDPEEIQKILDGWSAARRTRATGYLPSFAELHQISLISPADLQLVELQRQAALDVANITGLDPEDLGVSTTTRTYQNATDRRQDRINDTLAPYMRALTDRLSMGDVTRRGYRVILDLDDYMRADPTTRWGVYKTAVDMGAMTLADVAEAEDLPEKPRRAPVVTAPAGPGARTGIESTQEEPVTFTGTPDDAQSFRWEGQEFRVSAEKRTVAGTLIPYGAVGGNSQGRWRFSPGSVEWQRSAVSRVKLNREHVRTDLLGAATDIKSRETGVTATFRVARGAAGDQALSEAEDEVLDGLSAEVDVLDYTADPQNEGVYLVTRARLTGVALTGAPAFDDARLTSVAASQHSTEGITMTDATTGQTAPAAPAAAPDEGPDRDTIDRIVQAVLSSARPVTPPPVEGPAIVDPAARPIAFVREPLPYRRDRAGNFVLGDHEFCRDLLSMRQASDLDGRTTDAGRRVMSLLQAEFTVEVADVDELNPTLQRPDMFVDQRDYRTPLWDAVNKGAPPNGVQPFTFPKFNSASGLVGDHVAGTEPTSGNYTTAPQTVTPTAISGKASLQREVFDMGGNPAVSGVIFGQMRRGWAEGLESATATFLNTLTAAADINLGVAATDPAFVAAWEGALADLQFVRGYDWDVLVLEKETYKKFAGAKDTTGAPIFPIIGPMNRNGQAASRFRSLDLSGVTGIPSWALPSTAGAPNNSWLFDSSVVHGWATAPQRLEFSGGTNATGGYAPVAMVDIGIWGYKAFANSDIAGVRQVIYDTVA